MSSMVRTSLAALLFAPLLSASAASPALGDVQDETQWDIARASQLANGPGLMVNALQRWEMLTASAGFGFGDYSGFVLSYPGLPDEGKLRGYAEGRLEREAVEPERIVAFFDRFPPLTNPARGRYALALAAQGRPEALEMARAAWRGGKLGADSEAAINSLFGAYFNQQDQDARMDALLWDREAMAATRQFSFVSAEARQVFMARLSAVQGSSPAALGISVPDSAKSDPGYLYNIARQLRKSGQTPAAASLLATRPPLTRLPRDQAAWVEELLVTARSSDARTAQRIAASTDDAFPAGEDIRKHAYGLRDDYTSLMWLGGTRALWQLNEPATAAPLFWRYGAAAQTGQTRSKGFYWAGLASQRAGDGTGATRYFEMAAAYPDQFYGLLALERLGRPVPKLTTPPGIVPTPAERASFYARPLTTAVREAARNTRWTISIRFFKEIANQASSAADHMLVAQYAQELGRRDLAVILGEEAQSKGYPNFEVISFPTMPLPQGTDWTMVHAITRQESQFAQNAMSHAGARGLMQLMPGTAREQAGRMGLSYALPALIDDAGYNIQLGDGYFTRMLSYYNGSYPLAVAAYNAGPGNVNKWLASNGDPRNGGIDWIEWLERIPIYETRNYVQRVLENAAVYEQMHPEKTAYGKPRPLSRFIGLSSLR
jgi:soluble lytic murein transglycosylase